MAEPRVLLVTARFPPDVGGIETHVAEVAPRLRAIGFDAEVLTTDRTGRLRRDEMIAGVPVIRVRAWPRDRDYYLAPGLARAIRAAKPDLVHVEGYHTLVAPLAMATAARSGIPYVVSFHSGGHSSGLRRRLRPAQRLALRPLLRGAARLVAVSRFELDLFRRELRLARRRFALVRNGSTMPAPRTARAVDRPIVISVGRLERYKGHERLLAAWPKVLERVPSARLRILGTGPLETTLLEQVAAARLGSSVEISSVPATDRQALADALGEASLFVLLSEYEAHPVAVMEALAVGTPALVTKGTGLGDLVDDGLAAGILPSAGPEAIAGAIARELAHPRTVELDRLPTWDDCAAGLAAVYRDVLRGER